MIKLEYVPNGLEDIINYYGRPGKIVDKKFRAEGDWFAENVKVFHLSFPLRQSWDYREIRALHIHKLVGPAMMDALNEIHAFYGLRIMRLNGFDFTGGTYNPRLKSRSKELSTHSWAISIDQCPGLGPYDEPTMVPWPIVEAFLKRGFINFPAFDGMHFQACSKEY